MDLRKWIAVSASAVTLVLSPAVSAVEPPRRRSQQYGFTRLDLRVADSPAFVTLPEKEAEGGRRPWISYAPAIGRHPNARGLYDMHGNACEWTRSEYRPYPYSETDGRNNGIADCRLPIADLNSQSEIGNRKSEIARRFVVRGGSFYDRPKRGRSAFRLSYPAWRPVYNVGFRVLCDADGKKVVSAAGVRH